MTTRYHLDFSQWAENVEKGELGPFDNEGIPLVDFNKMFRIYRICRTRDFGIHYFPTVVAMLALDKFNKYLQTENETTKEEFAKLSNWFMRNAEEFDNVVVFLNHFEFPQYRLKPPWVNAMTQGMALSALTRMFEITNDSVFLEFSEKIFNTFNLSTDKGGCRTTDDNGYIWFEEYPSNPSSFVLNGFLFALFGIYDFYISTNSYKGKLLFDEGVKSLIANLHHYDVSRWSKYDRIKDIVANRNYHQLHIEQLEAISKIIGNNETICYFLDRWKKSHLSKYTQIKLLPYRAKVRMKQFVRLLKYIWSEK